MLPWQPFLGFYIWGAHWRRLKNTTEPSMCGGDAALCQITLTTCLCVLPSLLSLLLSLAFQNMDPLRFQAGDRRRRPNLGLVCFVLMFAVLLVKDACLFSLCLFSFSLVM